MSIGGWAEVRGHSRDGVLCPWTGQGDDLGFVKYWQNNMNTVTTFQAHKDMVRQATCVSTL